jgi:methionyl-tRNA formyltransferase
VDWSLPASYIHNRVRGLYPWPHAYTYIGGERLILLATRVHEPGAADRRDAAPGTVLAVARDALEVATGHHGTVAILEVQPEGRRPMKIGEYLAGHPIPAGGRFGSR